MIGLINNTKNVSDLDLRNPVYRKPLRRPGFETTTTEVLKKADFRVPFLTDGPHKNFGTFGSSVPKPYAESMNKLESCSMKSIVPDSSCLSGTGISAKAQRKVARR
ncbi:hypothetical protein QJS04_geneDACA004465 [Acorus gramineus]|uniref:Uncharacterized protein n=1 Tax=Acorus gramineus TaxID=55184 RepID=A0AAV9B781_ACOGR|nr:hypothetical protein QJS04_geneDACA004465 [Acorus gramineus]